MASTDIDGSVWPGGSLQMRPSSKQESTIRFDSVPGFSETLSGVLFDCSLTFFMMSAVVEGSAALFCCAPGNCCYWSSSLRCSLSSYWF